MFVLYIALSRATYACLRRSGMEHVLSIYLFIQTFIYTDEMSYSAFTLQPQSIIALRLVLISRPAEGRRLSWPRRLGCISRWYSRQRRSPIPVLTGLDVP